MGAIVAVSTNADEDARAVAESMLSTLKHRGSVVETRSIVGQEGESVKCALGCASHPNSSPKIASSPRLIVAVDGSFYEKPEFGEGEAILRQVERSSPSKAIKRAVNEIGGFVGLVARRKCLYAFRDVNGLKPLYYAHTRDLTGFASERKALWKIGLVDTQAFPPGYACTLTEKGFRKIQLAHFRHPTGKRMTLAQASANLSRLLTKAVKRITNETGKVAVAFSGGLDSALTAAIAKKVNVDVEAVSVGLPGSPELSTVNEFAQKMDLPITVETFSSDSVEEYVRRLLWLIEEPNLMKVSVAVPLHWAAMVAARRGCSVMLCGQGSDELFGGYYKYARTLDTKGRRALVAQLYRSVIESSQVNYERDDQATAPFGVELRTPFADPDVIRFSLTIPSEFKVKEHNDLTRKWVLRNTAKLFGLPDDIVSRRKKAIQHGTGVENAIRKLAKSHSLATDQYLSKMFEDVKRMESMP